MLAGSSTVENHELALIRQSRDMHEERSNRLSQPSLMQPAPAEFQHDDDDEDRIYVGDDDEETEGDAAKVSREVQRSTLRKLDWILLPFLALLFLLNSLDKSNLGNAESAGFSRDTGLSKDDINTALAFFFAFFVVLQPPAAALGRQVGMAIFVPTCMSLWGLCTIGHIWVRQKWHLIVLRIVIACLEAGFYPTTVSYLSLFYTRYEFAVRLGIFYGQSAIAGVLGGILSWAVFRHFPQVGYQRSEVSPRSEWRSWEVLFVIEGCLTITIALFGFFWLPRSGDSAWFLSAEEKWWAEERMRRDRIDPQNTLSPPNSRPRQRSVSFAPITQVVRRGNEDTEEAGDRMGLLTDHRRIPRKQSVASIRSITADSGLTWEEIVSAVFNYKIWLVLACNILSAIPATAFGVFLPMVMKQLTPSLKLTPAQSNLLAAPPFAFGAVVLFAFTWWSDSSRKRITPILWGLALVLIGLIISVMVPMQNYVLRYLSLCILLSGSYVPSPLTVAWLSNNTPEPGKRAILLGINGWGNLAGIFSALLFTSRDAETGYVHSFVVTLICVLSAFAGFLIFSHMIMRENRQRDLIMAQWTEDECEREHVYGDVPIRRNWTQRIEQLVRLQNSSVRRGDEKITYRYGT